MKNIVLLAALVGLAGCQTLSEPMPTGRGTYLIAGKGEGTLPTQQRLDGIQKATQFCVGLGQRFVLLPEPPTPGVAFECRAGGY